ncbi:hypothetical protein PSENEW3n2_00000620 [Picochlorum sp. SENEW3]|nr:hypothetical protein PSENEW3n2_00000620 [Picochlorum sp. SENEW3]WPT15540.1 hypothetical protein PSENEW3_00000620 [Picochlorum sp. SENEW3]
MGRSTRGRVNLGTFPEMVEFERGRKRSQSELEAIQSDMLAICDHIGDLVGSFGATSAFMAWIGPDLSLHMVRTGEPCLSRVTSLSLYKLV